MRFVKKEDISMIKKYFSIVVLLCGLHAFTLFGMQFSSGGTSSGMPNGAQYIYVDNGPAELIGKSVEVLGALQSFLWVDRIDELSETFKISKKYFIQNPPMEGITYCGCIKDENLGAAKMVALHDSWVRIENGCSCATLIAGPYFHGQPNKVELYTRPLSEVKDCCMNWGHENLLKYENFILSVCDYFERYCPLDHSQNVPANMYLTLFINAWRQRMS